MMICPTDTYSHKPTHHHMQQIILDMQQILEEVKHHDFYVTYYRQLVDDSLTQFQIVNTLQTLAADAQLKVSFNHALGLCIFERNE